MAELSTTFWLIAVALVALVLGGAWAVVRVLRARRPVPRLDSDDDA